MAAPSASAMAQDNSAAPAFQNFRLDPARDTNRPVAPERSGPEIDNRPAQTLPTPAQALPVAPPTVIQTINPTPERRIAPVWKADREAPAAVPDPATLETLPPQPAPRPSGSSSASSKAVLSPPASSAETGVSLWLWIGGALLVLAVGLLLLTRRRKTPVLEGPVIESVQVTPMRVKAPPPSPAPEPAPVPASSLSPVTLHFTPTQARTSLTGVQLGYALVLRNTSATMMEGLAVTAFLANADAQQALAAFFDDPFAPEAHRIDAIAPDAEVRVNGELRIDRIVPIAMQGRALLIPLVAFKVISLDGDELARAAFIVGQESTPPRDRMAPFRLDQGPRQFRTIGSRPAQVPIAA